MLDRTGDWKDGAAKKILFVSPSAPFPPTSGGAQRTALLLEALSEQAIVDLYLLGGSSLDRDTREVLVRDFRAVGFFTDASWSLRRAFRRLASSVSPGLGSILPDAAKVREVLKLLDRGSYSTLVLRYSATACQLRALRRYKPDISIIVDVDDLVAQLLVRPARDGRNGAFFRSLLPSWLGNWIKRRERAVLLDADGLWINGLRPSWLTDARLKVVELTNVPYNRTDRLASQARGSCGDTSPVFLGVAQFRYPPNCEGFGWFLSHVWPEIRRMMPQARLRLVGYPPQGRLLRHWLATPGGELTGVLPGVEGAYAEAAVAIAPILRGSGTKIKVLEALAMGLPCVCTVHASIGLGALTSLRVTDDPLQFAQYCLELAGDRDLRERIGNAGRSQVEANFSRADFFANVASLVEAPSA